MQRRKLFPVYQSCLFKRKQRKIKEVIFDGPQIRKLIKDPNSILSMNDVDANAWKAFVNVVINFLGNRKQDDYITLVDNLIKSLHAL